MPSRPLVRGAPRAAGPWGNLLDGPRGSTRGQGYRIQLDQAPKTGTAFSQTLMDVRQRILEETKVGKRGGNNNSNSKLLQAHRQRTWEMAFGQPGGDGVEVSTIEFSLICPYSRVALRYPVRSRDCRHLQCCDLDSWIALLDKCRSMRDPVAPCPVCEQRVAASSLEIDYWQMHVLSQMPLGTHMLVLDADGSYRSGDVSRDQKKQHVTEVIDSTQAASEGDDSGLFTLSPEPASSGPRGLGNNLTRVKRERVSEDAFEPPSLDFCSTSGRPTQDDDVVVVHYVEGTRPARVLPSQARLWVAHCPRCTTTLLKSESGDVECCATCGVERWEWTLLRTFPPTSVSLELTTDGTLILRGTDALAPHLLRAGFCRAVFVDETGTGCRRRDAELWYTTAALSRYELDFLEACCQRLASGESVDDMPAVPSRFRIPRRRPPRTGYAPTQISYTSLSA
ncbi:hypothetical protein DQ04_00401110 [Trypanosoma grayi]|uniref:hypothetical protein n=1 Tax=Trypanosoma grayi TaxID=71804 RepID=UPI0004F44E22|nr:hypothetical protein DQ04_00401110 [Trypanosoma grayi]KEG14571.1 hypothetical protein DQ04_00401110 [Trypanosoma grayi]